MSKSEMKSFADLFPISKLPSFGELSSSKPEEMNNSSLLRITEPLTLGPTGSNGKQSGSFPLSSTQSLNASRRNDGSNPKRLKLKDYLHLNSIEKKSKKSISSSKIQSEQSLELSKKSSIIQTNNSDSKPHTLYNSYTTQPPASRPSIDSNEILKEDIAKRIERQIKELNDLAEYVKKDFKVHENEAESHCLLFNTLNAVLDASKNYEAIGEQIIEYEKTESAPARNSKQYYWDNKDGELHSPARILQKGLQMTFNLTKMLGIKK